MNSPDDDQLRGSFQNWRKQESQVTPPFPELSPPAQKGNFSSPKFWIPASAGIAATLAAALFLGLPSNSTLADTLNRPLLPPNNGSKFIAVDPNRTLRPPKSEEPTTLFPDKTNR